MQVKNAATSGEMPLSATVVATCANDLPGSNQHGAHPLAQLRGEVGVVAREVDAVAGQRG